MKRLDDAKRMLMVALGVLVGIVFLNMFAPLLWWPGEFTGRALLAVSVTLLAVLTAQGMTMPRVVLGVFALAVTLVAGLSLVASLVVAPLHVPLMLVIGLACAFAGIMLLRPQMIAGMLGRLRVEP